MFRIVEREDGSTAIFDRTSGSLLKVIPSAPPPPTTLHPGPVIGKGPGPSRSGGPHASRMNANVNNMNNDINNVYHSASSMSNCDVKHHHNLQSVSSGGGGGSRSHSTPIGPAGLPEGRRLRPRNYCHDYNVMNEYGWEVDGSVQVGVDSPTAQPTTTTSRHNRININDNNNNNGKKPDHFVVVFKQVHNNNRDNNVATTTTTTTSAANTTNHNKGRSQSLDMTATAAKVHPVRMRLLPASTLDKICSTQDRHLGINGVSRNYFKRGESPGTSPEVFVDRPEPEVDQMDEMTYCKYLDLVPSSTVNRIPKGQLDHSWPLRLQSRTTTFRPSSSSSIRYHPYHQKGQNHQLSSQPQPQPSPSPTSIPHVVQIEKVGNGGHHLVMKASPHLLTTTSNTSTTSKTCLLRKSASFDGHFVTSHQPSATIENHQNQPTSNEDNHQNHNHQQLEQHHRKVLVKKFVTKYCLEPAANYRPGIELSSPLGRRLMDSYESFVTIDLSSANSLLKLVKSLDKSCGTNYSGTYRSFVQAVRAPFTSKVKVDFGLPTPSSRGSNVVTSRLLRSQNLINPSSNAWGLKSYHIYSFSKTERLEKALTLESGGLDWKGRLLSRWTCDDVTLQVVKMDSCPVCRVKFNNLRHSCLPPPPPPPEKEKKEEEIETKLIKREEEEEEEMEEEMMIEEEVIQEDEEEEEELVLVDCQPTSNPELLPETLFDASNIVKSHQQPSSTNTCTITEEGGIGEEEDLSLMMTEEVIEF